MKLSPCIDGDEFQEWEYVERHNLFKLGFNESIAGSYCMDFCQASWCAGKAHTKRCSYRFFKDQHYLVGQMFYEQPNDEESPQPVDEPNKRPPPMTEEDYLWYYVPEGY